MSWYTKAFQEYNQANKEAQQKRIEHLKSTFREIMEMDIDPQDGIYLLPDDYNGERIWVRSLYGETSKQLVFLRLGTNNVLYESDPCDRLYKVASELMHIDSWLYNKLPAWLLAAFRSLYPDVEVNF